jgi:hypothetical protein
MALFVAEYKIAEQKKTFKKLKGPGLIIQFQIY